MSDQQRLAQIYLVDLSCVECIRAVLYFNSLTDKVDLWRFIKRCLADTAIARWCDVFKPSRTDTYFKKLLTNCSIIETEKFTFDAVYSRIIIAAGLDSNEFYKFTDDAITFRDKWVAHRDLDADGIIHPFLDTAKKTALEMRNILSELINSLCELEITNDDSKELRKYINLNNNKYLLQWLSKESEQLKSKHHLIRGFNPHDGMVGFND